MLQGAIGGVRKVKKALARKSEPLRLPEDVLPSLQGAEPPKDEANAWDVDASA